MFLISDNIDTQTGMWLAGVESVVVNNKEGVRSVIEEALKDKSIAILLITEKLAALVPDYLKDIRFKYKSPLILEIPDRHGTKRSDDSITRYVRESVGLRL